MRVLLIVHGFPPRALGGTEIYTRNLARTLLREHGDEVFVLAREADQERAEYALRREDDGGVAVFFLNHTFRYSRSFEDTYRNATLRALAARLFDEIRPDVAHVQHLTCLSTDLVVELRRQGVPTFFTLHDYWLMCQRGQLLDLDLRPCDGPHRGCRRCADAVAGLPEAVHRAAPLWRVLQRFLPARLAASLRRGILRSLTDPRAAETALERRSRHVRWIAGQVTLFLGPSRTVLERHRDFGFPGDRLRYQPLGIDVRRFADRKRTTGGKLRIAFLGSLMVSKAPHLLLEAFAGLPAGSASLDVCGGFAAYHGDGSYRGLLEPLLAAPGVRHHGAVPNSEIPRVLAATDVVVVPSVWLENAPLTIHEAFAAGVPVVASDLGGMAEAVEHEKSGLLFRPGDAADMRRCLERLIDEPGLLRRLRDGIPPATTLEDAVAEVRDLYLSTPVPERAASRLAAVVLNYKTPRETVLAVRSLQSSERRADEIVVVDNGSGDGSAELLRQELRGVRILETANNLGFSGGVNAGVRAVLDAGAELVLVLNSDVMVAPECLGRLEEALEADPEVGVTGPVVLAGQDPTWVESRSIAFSPTTGRMRLAGAGELHDPHTAAARRVDAVTGCAMLVRREVFAGAGLFDEDYFFSFEDLDLCLRARRAGWASVAVGDAVAYHLGSRTIGAESPRRLYFAARNHLLLARRAAPAPWPLAFVRGKWILALNLAHALRGGGRTERLLAVLRGTADHLRGRYGPDRAGRARRSRRPGASS